MNRLIVILLAIIIIGFGAYLIFSQRGEDDATEPDSSGTSNLFQAENNAIVVFEQPAGAPTVTASSVFLATPGFVVVHEDASGTPGAILGVSSVLEIGESINVQVPLSRPMRDGERLYAMLHADVDGDFVFNAATDAPIQSALGGSIMMIFEASSDAPTNTPATI
ncbi:MAG TPA: hypothetical protein VJ837_02675 [Candidatus Paceibacterota bacterium]|nr:hypothetical protein [Candidatus Paceibacterota bacterium]